MTTSSITPLSILQDHPSVYRIPKTGERLKPQKKKKATSIIEDEEPQEDLEALEVARENVRTAIEGRKRTNLNDMILPEPERPEFNQERADKAKNLTKKAAIIQLIDSIASAGQMAAYGDEAIVAPVDYSGTGFDALNTLATMDEQHRIDLRDYNRNKEYVDRENRRIGQGLRDFNSGVDLDLANWDLEQARLNYQQDLNESERERLTEDTEARRSYEIGLRMASQGEIEVANEFFKNAGLSNESIEAQIKKGRQIQQGQQFSSIPSELETLGIKPRDVSLYKKMRSIRSQIDPNKHYAKRYDPQSGGEVPDYTKPIPGTPAEDFQILKNDLGTNYYLIDQEIGGQTSNGRSQQFMKASRQMQQSPQIQQKQLQAQKTMQSTLMHGYVNAQNERQRQQSKELWMKNNSEILRKMGVDEDEITSLNEEMFELMKNEMSGTRSTGNLARGREGSGAGDRPAQAGRRDASNGIDDVYNAYKNSGVQVKSRQTEKLRNIYGDQWKDVLRRVKLTYPQRNEDFLMYLMAESPELIQKDQGIKPSLQTAPALSTGITLAGFGKVSNMSNSEFREKFKEKYGDVQNFEELSEALNLSPEEARGLYQDMMIQMSRSDLSDSVINSITGRLFGVDMKGDLYPVSIPGHFVDRISSIGKDAGVVWDALQKSLEKRRKEYERRAVQSLIDSLPQQ